LPHSLFVLPTNTNVKARTPLYPAANPGPALAYQQQYSQQPLPVMVYQHNNALIAQYQKEIAQNELDCSDIAWFICCGPLALICCLPKYNA